MLKKPRRRTVPTQSMLFDDIQEPPASRPAILPMDFEGNRIRAIELDGRPWWLAVDAGRGMGISNISQTVKGQERTRPDGSSYWSGGLDEDEWCLHTVYGPSGPVEMLLVNEPGIYALTFKSRTKQAKRFKRWLTHEVIPAIRKYGFYSLASLANSRASKVARRLRCDPDTAAIRVRQYKANAETRARMLSEGGCVNDVIRWHNGGYLGLFGADAARLREKLGLRPWQTPLDRMSGLALSQNEHSKQIAERMIADSPGPVPPSLQSEIIRQTARAMIQADLNRLGPGHALDVRDDPQRGKIIDVVRTQLGG